MKTSERHQLKTNEVASTVAQFTEWFSGRGSQLAWVAGAVVVLALAVGAFWAWRSSTRERAGELLAEAMAISQSPTLPAAAPGTTAPPPSPGTFPTEQARNEAFAKKLREIVQQYPSTPAGTAARSELASLLLSVGKTQEAEQQFRQLADERGIYGQTARLGLAEIQVEGGKYDDAIATYRDMLARTDGALPADGLLMQLGRTYELAGKRAEARQAYQRIVTEFPNSIYASDARQLVESLGQDVKAS